VSNSVSLSLSLCLSLSLSVCLCLSLSLSLSVSLSLCLSLSLSLYLSLSLSLSLSICLSIYLSIKKITCHSTLSYTVKMVKSAHYLSSHKPAQRILADLSHSSDLQYCSFIIYSMKYSSIIILHIILSITLQTTLVKLADQSVDA